MQGRSRDRVDDDEELKRVRGELERLVAVRLQRPLNVAERDLWKKLTVIERDLLELDSSVDVSDTRRSAVGPSTTF